MSMPLKLIAVTLLTLLCTAGARADGAAGQFNYYVLSLSWSPTWCDEQGGDAPQCDRGRRTGFVVHGLWPQYERGWPSKCASRARDPSRRDSEGMADLMGSAGLAWYQWKEHGRCSGLSGTQYYETLRDAANSVAIPVLFQMLPRDVTLPAPVIEDAFIAANPTLTRDGITVQCTHRAMDEVRICLTPDLSPRACAPDTRRDCAGPMLMQAPR